MRDFKYACANSLDHALTLLNDPAYQNRVLAGGTDLLVAMRTAPINYTRLVDVTRVPELKQIEANGKITIGAAVTISAIVGNALLQRNAPLLVKACSQIGSVQIRNAATIGGNIVNAAACADSLPALVCLGAEAVIDTPQGEQRCLLENWIVNVNKTLLPTGSLLRAVTFDPQPEGSRFNFQRIGRRQAMSIARISLAAMGKKDPDGKIAWLRLAPGAAMATIHRITAVEDMLVGQLPSEALITSAAARMVELYLAESGKRWSADWKKRALAAITERALRQVTGA